MDLYLVLKDDAIEKELTLLKGFINVSDSDTMPQNIVINLTDNETGKLVAQSRPSQRNGSFVFIIPPGENYNISYEIEGKDFYNENIYVPFGSQYQEINKEILLDPIALTAKAIDKETDEQWIVKFQSLGAILPAGLVLKCHNKAGDLLFTAVKKEDGSFAFSHLPEDENYLFMLYDEDSKIIDCSGIEIALFQRSGQKAVLFPNKDCEFLATESNKVGKIAFVNLDDIPSNLKIQYLDDDGTIYYSENIDENGYFKYIETPENKQIRLQLISDAPCSGAQLQIVQSGDEATVLIEFTATEEGGCSFVPITKDKLSYQEFFTYNKNYPKKEKELQNFIVKVAEQINSTGNVKISIESSASKVPTTTYDTNNQLSKLRSEIAKKMLLDSLAKIGIEKDKVTFVKINTLVQGPKYKGDYLENKTMYEKYQYVKIYSE
jgi:hypothetical protein